MSTWMQDLRYALRSMAATPGFTALAVVTLALGIGASTAIFSVANAVLWKPLPYPGADAIVAISEVTPDGESNTGFATFKDLERESRTLATLTVASEWQPSLTGSGEPERLEAQRVTSGYFRTLGVRPAIGRDFTASDDVRGSHFSVILSHGLWQRRFGGDASLLGKTITLNEHPYTLVGVMPEDFQNFIKPAVEAWAPLGYDESLPWACRTCRHLREFGRLREGVTLAEAARELNHISADIVRAHPQDYVAPGMAVAPLGEILTRSIRPALLALLGGVGFVVLIACANVANLLLGRAVQRESAFAVRAALGAGRARVVRQILTENLVLFLLAGLVSMVFARYGLRWIEGSFSDETRGHLPDRAEAGFPVQRSGWDARSGAHRRAHACAVVDGIPFGRLGLRAQRNGYWESVYWADQNAHPRHSRSFCPPFFLADFSRRRTGTVRRCDAVRLDF